jgi:nucleotide-binding universal stress UspA family protein
MKRILMPTDFSDCAMLALEFAGNLARKTSGEIYLIHVIEVPAAYSNFSVTGEWGVTADSTTADVRFMIELMRETKIKMSKILEHKSLLGLNVSDNIEVGSPGKCISEAAEKYHADLIVMGTHGNSGLNELFMGSNAEKVVRYSSHPVLTIRESINMTPKKIVFASDFSNEADQVWPVIKSFADVYNASINLLKVNTLETYETTRETEKSISGFQERNQAQSIPFDIYNDLVHESGILHYSKDHEIDIIALGTHGRQGLSRLFTGSISEDIANHSLKPVLTINFNRT